MIFCYLNSVNGLHALAASNLLGQGCLNPDSALL